LLLILLIGTAGYKLIEGWSLFDALFMTVTTVTTIGFREAFPLSRAGQIFSIFLVLGGVGTAFYILTSLVRYVLEGDLGIIIGRQRMEAKIARLKDHFILCGYGRVGQAIANILRQQDAKFVVIDRSPDAINKAQKAGHLTIHADTTMDESLKQARVETARGIVIALGDDASNIYTTLAAQELNSKIPIVARANSEEAGRKLVQAGVDSVVAPEVIGGTKMARLALKPKAVEFIETVKFGAEKQLVVEEIDVAKESPLVGSTIKQTEKKFAGIRILALTGKNGVLLPNPTPQTRVDKDCSLTVFGTLEQLKSIEACCLPGRAPVKRPGKNRAK